MQLFRRPSPAMVVAWIALIVALGGTGYAAVKLPRNSVGTKQLKKDAVTAAKVKDGSLGAKDFAAGQLPRGPQGPEGPKGEKGDKGDKGDGGAVQAWSEDAYPASGVPQADGHVAKFTFTPPAAGSALITAHFGIRIRNAFNSTAVDCHVESQISPAPGKPATSPGTAQPGYIDQWINGNLPTQNGSGTYLELNASVSRIIPVSAAATTVYLNGAHSCVSALWGPINITAILVSTSSATLSVP